MNVKLLSKNYLQYDFWGCSLVDKTCLLGDKKLVRKLAILVQRAIFYKIWKFVG